jgi:hypothetical protein
MTPADGMIRRRTPEGALLCRPRRRRGYRPACDPTEARGVTLGNGRNGSVAGFQRATFVALGVSQNPSIFGLKSLLQIS